MAAASTSSSRITRTRSRKAKARITVTPLANIWMHNGFLNVEGEKMSKSLGNFVTINELLKDWPGEVLRFNMLRTHYRQPMDWTVAGMNESWKTLEKWYAVTEPLADPPVGDGVPRRADATTSTRRRRSRNCTKAAITSLPAAWRCLGFSNVQLRTHRGEDRRSTTVAIADAIEARNAARKATRLQGVATASATNCSAKGIVLKDGPDGTTWEVKR